MKKLNKFMSLILVMAIFFSGVNVTVFSVTYDEYIESNSSEEELEGESEQDPNNDEPTEQGYDEGFAEDRSDEEFVDDRPKEECGEEQPEEEFEEDRSREGESTEDQPEEEEFMEDQPEEEETVEFQSGEEEVVEDQTEEEDFEEEIEIFEEIIININDYSFDEIIDDDVTITTSTTISDRIVLYTGDVTINANVNVISSTIIVLGTVNIDSGSLIVNTNSDMYIFDDFRIQSKDINGDFIVTSGYAQLTNNAKLTVYGDFYTQTTTYSYFGNSGIFQLHGDFKQIGTNTVFYHNESNFKITFAGSREQRTSFDRHDSNASLGRIEVINASQSVYFDTPTYKLHTINNAKIIGDIDVKTITNSTNELEIIGSLVINTGYIQINDELVVTGDVYIQSGFLFIYNNLTVSRDFRIQSKDINGNFGETSGCAQLSNNRKLTVYGDFYTQTTAYSHFGNSGILQLHGDFKQIGTNTLFYHNESNFKIAFAGSGEQRISFDRHDSNASLGKIEVINASQTIYIDSPTFRIELLTPTTFVGNVKIHSLSINNHELTVNGTLELLGWSVINGVINVTNGFIVNSSLYIDSNPVINGDVYIKSGSLSLSNNTFIVNGNVYVQGGALLMNFNCQMTIRGDFRIQSQDANGNYGATSGYAQVNASSKLTVYGDFYTQSTNSASFGLGNYINPGMFELHGNFKQIGMNTFFYLNYDFILVFAGDGEQHVSFDRCESGASLYRVMVTNPSQTIYFDTPIYRIELLTPVTLVGDVKLHQLVTNGNELTVIGTLELLSNHITIKGIINVTNGFLFSVYVAIDGSTIINGDIYVKNNGRLSINSNSFVNGDVHVQGGSLIINSNIEMAVSGDFRIQSQDVNGNFGVTNGYTQLTGSSKLTVYGDFYTQSTSYSYFGNSGILELHGNFRQIGIDTFFFHASYNYFNVVFAGNSEQHVSFDRCDYGAYLGRIEVLNSSQTVHFDTPIYRVELLTPATFTGYAGRIEIHQFVSNNTELNVNGILELLGTSTISGVINVTDRFVSNGWVSMNGFPIINGDVYVKSGWLTSNIKNTVVIINGDIHVQGGYLLVDTNSEMIISGDFRIQSQDANGNFISTNGYARLYSGTKLTVYGDFYTQSTFSNGYFGYASGANAVLELHGNFKQIGTDTFFNHWYSYFIVDFAGDGEQHVSFDRFDYNAYFISIAVTNSSQTIYLDTPIYRVDLLTPVTFVGDVRTQQLLTNNHELTVIGTLKLLLGSNSIINGVINVERDFIVNCWIPISGNLTINGDVYIKSGILSTSWNNTLVVNGDVHIQGGTLSVNTNSTMIISGDFRIQSQDIDGNYIETNGDVCLGNGSKLIVYGDFYTQSTSNSTFGRALSSTPPNPAVLELHGDFRQIGTNTYFHHWNSGMFIMVFAGAGKQYISLDRYDSAVMLGSIIALSGTIYFDTPTYYFYPLHDIVVKGNIEIHSLIVSEVVVNLKSPAKIGGIGINGEWGTVICDNVLTLQSNTAIINGSLHCKDDLIVEGSISLNNSFLYVEKDVIINGNIGLNNGFLYVEQDIIINSSYAMYMGNSIVSAENFVITSRSFSYHNHWYDYYFYSGVLEIRNNFITLYPIAFVTHDNLLVQLWGDVFYPDNGFVRFGSLAGNQNTTIHRGAQTYSLNLNGLNCNNSYCNFKSHCSVFPMSKYTFSCGNLIYCNSVTCHYVTYYGQSCVCGISGSCSSCTYCRICYDCDNKIIYNYFYNETIDITPLSIADINPLSEQIKMRYFGQLGIHSPTGNYSESFTDMTVATVLGDLTFTRTYNSLDGRVSNVGKGFSFSYDMKIITDKYDSSKKCVMLPNGSMWRFEENNGVFTAQDSRGVLTMSGSDYILETLEQMRYVFDSSGYIKYVEDFKGNRVTITIGADGRIVSLTDPAGASVSFGYNNDRLTSITDNKSGRAVSYTYNGNLLIQTIDAAGMTTEYSYTNDLLTAIDDNINRRVLTLTYYDSACEGKVHTVIDVTGNMQTYTYDTTNMQTTITDSNGRTTVQGYGFDYAVTTSTNGLGYTERVSYLLIDGKNKYNEVRSTTDMYGNITIHDRDNKGNIIKTTHPDSSTEKYTFDSLNNMTSYTDRSGAVTWYEYDGYNLVKEICPIDGVSSYSIYANQDNYAITNYTYYPSNQTVKHGSIMTVTTPTGDANNYIAYQYNSYGEVSEMTHFIDGVPYSTQYTYDNVHRVISESAPDNTLTVYVYNQAGQITQKTISNGYSSTSIQTVYDNLGRTVKEISPIGGESRYFYNNEGFIKRQTDALGNSTCFEYDYYGNIIKQTLANNSYSLFTYDELNRKTSEHFYDSVTGVQSTIKEIQYSRLNRNSIVTSTVHIDESLTSTTIEKFNFEGNLIEQIDPNGAKYTYNYINGRLVSEHNANITNTTYTYNVWGNITKTTSSFDSTGRTETLYTYDKAGNVTSQQVKNNAPKQSVTYTRTDFIYDKLGQNTAIIYYDNNIEEGRISFVYDWAGRVIEEHKGVNSVVQYQYDCFGNIISKTDAINQIETFGYDPAGQLIFSTDRNGTHHTITYDLTGNPLTKTNTNGGITQSKSYTYDNMGNLLTVDDGNGVITYTYDGSGNRLTESRSDVVKTFGYNNVGWLTDSVIEINNTVQQCVGYEYNDMGQIVKVFEDNSLVTDYEYDILGREVKVTNANGTVQTTVYNSAGLVISVKNTCGNDTISEYLYDYYYDGNQRTKTEFAGTTTYIYDGLNRLKTAILHDGTVQQYEFDKNGNRTKLTSALGNGDLITTYTYDLNDRIISENKDGEITTYTYDSNGNILCKSGGVTITQEFDLLNRMTRYSDGTTTAEYTYNPDNMRSSKTVNSITTEHIWIGTDIALDIFGGNAVSYIGGIKSSYGWHLYNAHGDVVQLADDYGGVIRYYDYDPYGNQLSDADFADLNPYRFSDEYYDNESGYVYLRARYYDPSVGRFISEDPALDGDNWYIYCGNNPVMYQDPSGESFILAAIAVGAAVGAWASNISQLKQNGGDWGAIDVGQTAVGALKGGAMGAAMAVPGVQGLGVVSTMGYAGLVGAGIESVSQLAGYARGKDVDYGAIAGAGIGSALGAGLGKVVGNRISAARTPATDWRVGQPIDNLTSAGNKPSWGAVRQRYWKNEAHFNPQRFDTNNLARAQRGLAPQRLSDATGKMESMHLHHIRGRNILDPHAKSNLRELWSEEHYRIHRKGGGR